MPPDCDFTMSYSLREHSEESDCTCCCVWPECWITVYEVQLGHLNNLQMIQMKTDKAERFTAFIDLFVS